MRYVNCDAETDDLAYNTCVRPPIWAPDDTNATMTATIGRQQPYKACNGS